MKTLTKPLLSVSALLLAFTALACTSTATDPKTAERQDTWVQGTELGRGSDQALSSLPQDFALDLTKEMLSETAADENLFISPFSVMVALTMALNGAGGDTYAEMADVLGAADVSTESWNRSMETLLEALGGGADERVELAIANAMWLAQGEPIGELFIKRNEQYLGSEVKSLDFKNSSAVDVINDWISDHTNERIKDIIAELDPATIAVLANAIYFNAEWSKKFKAKDTHDAVFTQASGAQLDVQMLAQGGRALYAQSEDYQALRKPYGDGRFAMTVVLPAEGKGTGAITPLLEAGAWQELQDSLTMQEGRFEMPKLEIEWGGESLVEPLRALGMNKAFGGADFSGIAPNLFISDVIHKSFLRIDEEGTEAAAATVVIIERTSAPMQPEDPFEMICNRPFFIAITDTQSSAILFSGMINKPKSR